MNRTARKRGYLFVCTGTNGRGDAGQRAGERHTYSVDGGHKSYSVRDGDMQACYAQGSRKSSKAVASRKQGKIILQNDESQRPSLTRRHWRKSANACNSLPIALTSATVGLRA